MTAPRTPTDPDVDLAWYEAQYPDVRLSGLTPAEHWRRIGRLLGRPGRPEGGGAPAQPAAIRPAAQGRAVATDHALVVHVWHLDVVQELADAAARLPYQIDQFVTLPSHFAETERQQIAGAFPRARLIQVENLGQDIGALFQLMKQVDLGRYAFICKIHTKKGPNMPNEWRRALLDGVLGSERQASHIIERFRAEPRVMMAGARQLYVHGPAYIYQNAALIEGAFAPVLKGFPFLDRDWGFVAGTCFWIRTAILTDLARHVPPFAASDYQSDGTLAHAIERMFGLMVRLKDGHVLLQDLAVPQRLPDEEKSFPSNLPKQPINLLKILTPLAANLIIPQPEFPLLAPSGPVSRRKRVAVFASYSADGTLPPQVEPYLAGLRKIADTVVLVCDNDLLPGEAAQIGHLATHVITGRHKEYDFGSYKRGIAWAQRAGHLKDADELILCNDSCFGPLYPFEHLFDTMAGRGLDFWGITDSHQYSYHLQSYFIVFSRKVLQSSVFGRFFAGVKGLANVREVIQTYELGLTRELQAAGFTAGALIDNNFVPLHPNDTSYANLGAFPLYAIARGSPLLKVKAMRYAHTNIHGANRVLRWLEDHCPRIHAAVTADVDMARFAGADRIAFSVILPTRNRAHCIEKAIRSVLAQSHPNFELIIVDDQSTDGTEHLITEGYADFIQSGKIRYIRLDRNLGVSGARNIGIAHSTHPWIAYVDSDNEMRAYMLTMFANAICQNPGAEAFYARVFNHEAGKDIGGPFDFGRLVEKNFIDMGVYVHAKALVGRYGGFDQGLRRLVDWEMIIRHTRDKPPVYVQRTCVDYSDDGAASDRISVRESVVKALAAVWTRHSPKPVISSVIVSYNHEAFIREAIESALAQKGDFHHEIILADDGSTDRTPEIISDYVARNPYRMRSIGRGRNLGISGNYRHAFAEAEGRFIAILEGDDYWNDPEKLSKQANVLTRNPEASMVLARIELLDMKKGERRLLDRQEGLPKLLTARHFAEDESLNLIVNLSCCMFRSEIMKRLPDALYEHRLSEIALAFYLDRIGPIGFVPEVLSTYRLNAQSVWTGADVISKHQQAIAVRETALRMARPIYRATIQSHIDERRRILEAERARAKPAA